MITTSNSNNMEIGKKLLLYYFCYYYCYIIITSLILSSISVVIIISIPIAVISNSNPAITIIIWNSCRNIVIFLIKMNIKHDNDHIPTNIVPWSMDWFSRENLNRKDHRYFSHKI